MLCLYKCYFGVFKKNIIIKPLIMSHHLEKINQKEDKKYGMADFF